MAGTYSSFFRTWTRDDKEVARVVQLEADAKAAESAEPEPPLEGFVREGSYVREVDIPGKKISI